MNTLVINPGSNTIKYNLYDVDNTSLLSGIIDEQNGELNYKLFKNSQVYEWNGPKEGHHVIAQKISKELLGYQINNIAFRIVHGGEKYKSPTLLNDNVIKELSLLNDLAPLHNPIALNYIRFFKQLYTNAKFIGVFDTAFHQSMPKKSYLYAIPYEFYETYKIRRYGFHGISNQYLTSELSILEPGVSKVINCHLGSGASITAVLDNKSIDTSMGFTPLEGLIMGTRPGDIDDGAIHYLMNKLHMSVKDMQDIENNYSGLLGISGISADMRELLMYEAQGHNRSKLAIAMYIYRIQRYIGMYSASLHGIDALVFSGGVGTGSDIIRQRICEGLEYLGIKIDNKLNDNQQNVKSNLKISTNNSIPIWIIPTNEELQIAREVSQVNL
jgi:acetate kinase